MFFVLGFWFSLGGSGRVLGVWGFFILFGGFCVVGFFF